MFFIEAKWYAPYLLDRPRRRRSLIIVEQERRSRERNMEKFTFTYQSGCRCFVGMKIRDGTCAWQEWNAVAYDSFVAEILALWREEIVQVWGDELNMLVKQPNSVCYHLKVFLTQDALHAYLLRNLWDHDFLVVAAPEMLPRIEFKQAA